MSDLFYNPQLYFTPAYCAEIFANPLQLNKGCWSKFNTSIRSDLVTDFYTAEHWTAIKNKMSGSHLYRMDHLHAGFTLHCLPPGTYYGWHTDEISKKGVSIRSRTVIITVKKGISSLLETEKGIFDLPEGWGIQIPIGDRYQILGPQITKDNHDNDHWVLIGWGMQRLSDYYWKKNFDN